MTTMQDISLLLEGTTWIDKAEWSFFCYDRFEALQQFQQTIREKQPRPRNYVILSGLIGYLMQSISSTPVKVPSFVRKALGNLRFGANMERCGQFFIEGVDFSKDDVVDDIEKRDTVGVFAEAKLSITVQSKVGFSFEDWIMEDR